MKLFLSQEVLLGATMVHFLYEHLNIRPEKAASIAEEVLSHVLRVENTEVHNRIFADYKADVEHEATFVDFLTEVPGMDYFSEKPISIPLTLT